MITDKDLESVENLLKSKAVLKLRPLVRTLLIRAARDAFDGRNFNARGATLESERSVALAKRALAKRAETPEGQRVVDISLEGQDNSSAKYIKGKLPANHEIVSDVTPVQVINQLEEIKQIGQRLMDSLKPLQGKTRGKASVSWEALAAKIRTARSDISTAMLQLGAVQKLAEEDDQTLLEENTSHRNRPKRKIIIP